MWSRHKSNEKMLVTHGNSAANHTEPPGVLAGCQRAGSLVRSRRRESSLMVVVLMLHYVKPSLLAPANSMALPWPGGWGGLRGRGALVGKWAGLMSVLLAG